MITEWAAKIQIKRKKDQWKKKKKEQEIWREMELN